MKVNTKKIDGHGFSHGSAICLPRDLVDPQSPPETLEITHEGEKRTYKVRRAENIRHGHMLTGKNDRLRGGRVRLFLDQVEDEPKAKAVKPKANEPKADEPSDPKK